MIINFNAITSAYTTDTQARNDFHALFACISSYNFWTVIKNCQRTGVTDSNAPFVEKNKVAFCEKNEYVDNKISTYLLKTIRLAVALNSELKRRGRDIFIVKVLKRDEQGFWSLFDAKMIADEITEDFLQYVGKSITDTCWMLNR